MDHVTAIITQLAQGLFESIGSSLLRSVRGRGLVKSEPASRRGPGLSFGFQLRLLHRPARLQDRPRQLAVYRIDLQAQPRRVTKSG
jgi:hypothetical protein